MGWRDKVNNLLGHTQNVFGNAITFTPLTTGIPAPARGIFNEKFEGVDPDTGFVIASQTPNLGIRMIEWPVLPIPGDKLNIYGKIYTIRHMEPDGEGGATLMLSIDTGVVGS